MLSLLIHDIGWYSKTHLAVQRVSRFNFSSTHLLTFFKGSTSSIISASSSPSISSSQSTLTIQSAGRGKTFRPERSQASAQAAPCMFTPSFLYGIFPHTLF